MSYQTLLAGFYANIVAGFVADIDRTAYNGHFGCTCYHPLFVFNQFGDLERCALRPGNVHSAHGWRDVLEPVVTGYRGKQLRRFFRGDVAFALPDIYEFLEVKGFGYAICLPANAVLQSNIAHLLKRPVGRPPKEVRRYHANFSYRAASWSKARRVVAKVEWHPGELYPRVGLDRLHRSSVTNFARPAERVVVFYNQRGTAEQWIKEGKHAIRWTRLSCRKFAHNAVRLQLHALAYNLGNFLRTLALPDAVRHWSMTTLRDRLIKIVRHGRYVTFQMAEVAVPRDLFADILSHISDEGLGLIKRFSGFSPTSNEVDGIRAPTMLLTHQIHYRMAANWSFFERVTLRATVRCKLIACDTDPNHTFGG